MCMFQIQSSSESCHTKYIQPCHLNSCHKFSGLSKGCHIPQSLCSVVLDDNSQVQLIHPNHNYYPDYMKNSPHGRNTLCTLLHSGQDASRFLHCHDIGQLENCVTYMMSNTIHRKHLSCMQGMFCEQNSLSWHKVGGIVQLMALLNKESLFGSTQG